MNGDTKLAEALRCNAAILDYVISLNPHDFQRLRNPLMRRIMPVRITLRRLASMVDVPEQEFVDKINTLAGLQLEKIDAERVAPPVASIEPPEWMAAVDESRIRWVDVLPGARRRKLRRSHAPNKHRSKCLEAWRSFRNQTQMAAAAAFGHMANMRL